MKVWVVAAVFMGAAASISYGGLTFYVDPNSPWPAGWYDAAVADMRTVVNEYNAYGDFGGGSIYVYYNAGIPTEQSGYGGWGGSIGVGGRYPDTSVLLHETSHWLGTGTYSSNWSGPHAAALIQQFDGVGAVLNGDSQHYWPYGENYPNESSPINDARHVAMVYALREDFGIGSTAPPSSAKNVTLKASDAAGASGFNYPWGWSDNHFAQPGTNYSTGRFDLRTPNGYPSWTFAGESLTVNAGGRLLFNGWGTTGVVTIKNLTLAGGTVRHDQFSQDLFQLAGKVTLAPNTTSTFETANGNIKVLAPIDGRGALAKTGSYTLTLSAGNSYAGPTMIKAGTLRLSAPAPVANYGFNHLSGNTVINDGTGGAALNGTFNANGGTGAVHTTGGPAAGLGALVLNGTGSTVDINSGITDLSGDGSWTVSAWVKTTQAGATIFNKGDGKNWNSGFSTFYLGDGSDTGSGSLPDAVRWGGGWVAGSARVNNGAWHQITYTDAGGTKSVYVDGVPTTLSQNQFLNADTGSKIRIGFAPDPGDGAATTNGSLSGIKFFNVPLSADQAAQLYRGGPLSVLPAATDVSIAAGATLDVNGVTQSIGALSGPAGAAIRLGGGALSMGNSGASEFDGDIAGPGDLVVRGPGALTLGARGGLSFSSLTVAGGTLTLGGAGGPGAPLNLTGPLTVADGALAQITPGSSGMTQVVGGLNLNATGRLDLGNHSLLIRYGSASSPDTLVRDYLIRGIQSTGQIGLTSNTASSDPLHFSLAYSDGADGVVAGLAAGSELVKLTLPGDANLDGAVDFNDLLLLAQHYGSTTARWDQGDLNYDGAVGFNDLLSLAQHYAQAPTTAAVTSAPVPEPNLAVVLAVCVGLFLRRRRRVWERAEA